VILESFKNTVFKIDSHREFEDHAWQLYQCQRKNNAVYREFCELLARPEPSSIPEIPFLPIEFFKSRRVLSTSDPIQHTFESSGTSDYNARSRHYITDLHTYEQSFNAGFDTFFGDPSNYVILALLPGYEERSNSSLIYMVNQLIQRSKHVTNGFYAERYREAAALAWEVHREGKRRPLIFGVSFALLDMAEQQISLPPSAVLIETGGMKGRRKELTRAELHKIISAGTGIEHIRSEYGMTELLSQGYSDERGNFQTPPWMQLLIRDPEDPLSPLPDGRTGGINAIDLANIHSCAFIATQDLGRKWSDGTVEVLGRFDYSDVRGCNLIMA
jgi:hypothetical protein